MYFHTFNFSFEQGEILSQLTLVFYLLECMSKPQAYNMKNTILFSSCQHYFILMKQYFFSTASFLRLAVNTEVFTKCSVLFKTEKSESEVKSFTPQKG